MTALSALRSEVAALDKLGTRMGANEAKLRARADARIGEAIERGAALYDRERHLPLLFHRSKWEGLSDGQIVDMLSRAVTAGSKALVAGRWHADGNRVMALRQALAGELVAGEGQ